MAFLCFAKTFKTQPVFERRISLVYNCHAPKDFYVRLYLFFSRFHRQEHLYETDCDLASAAIIILTNFLSKPYLKKAFLRFRKLVIRELRQHKVFQSSHSNDRHISFEKFLALLKKEIGYLEKMLYSLLHDADLLKTVMSPAEYKCDAISSQARKVHIYSNCGIDLNISLTQDSFLLALPDVLFRQILGFLTNSEKIALIFSCKQLFKQCAPLLKLDYFNRFTFLQQSRSGICIYQKFSKNRHAATKKGCVCPLCLDSCPCDYSNYQMYSVQRDLVLRNVPINHFFVNSREDLNLLPTLKCPPYNVQVTIPLQVNELQRLFSAFPFFRNLNYIVDVRMLDSRETFSIPPIEALSVKFIHCTYIASFSTVSTISKLITPPPLTNSSSAQSMRKLQLINCQYIDSLFLNLNFNSLSPSQAVWIENLVSLDINSTRIKCEYFQYLDRFISLATLSVHNVQVCKQQHFYKLFRTDRHNFSKLQKRNKYIFSRPTFLRIYCDPTLRCQCFNITSRKCRWGKTLNSTILYDLTFCLLCCG